MALREYQRKRHFQRTSEPKGKKEATEGRSFVVQKHQARHLHYDFRLELDGVLKSWAVPKGPCLDPAVKRLAIHVEDHPVEYGSFEGIIPKGEYGGGTVMLWDRGVWEAVGDPREGYRTGKLKFKLHGKKLRGGWMLVRTGSRRSTDRDERHWLLFKERDEEAREKEDVPGELSTSVSTGRTLEEIAADRERQWNGKAKSNGRMKSSSQLARKIPGAKPASFPSRVEVQLATLSKEPPSGDEWLHEIKFDGYRMICRIDNRRAQFITRNHKDWTKRLPFLAEAAQRLPVRQAILDGEVVVLRPDGTTDFQDLQNAFRDQRPEALHYFAFDLLHLDGYDLTRAPLEERKRVLADVLARSGDALHIHLSEHMKGKGPAFFAQASKMRLEGMISKRRDQPYQPGRGYAWLKVKCLQNEEFVIGGYTDPSGSRAGFGALLIGSHNAKGDLVYAGKVGTGFDNRMLEFLLEKLQPFKRKDSPFLNLKRGGARTHWVEPKVVAQVAFGAWTRDGLLRHASFQGLREDKPAAEVTREKPMPVSRAARKTKGKTSVVQNSLARRTPSERAMQAGHDAYDARKQLLAGVRFTSPDKVLYPDQGITKLELAHYYQAIAEWILPHIADRPLVLVRCPEGQKKACFFQKHPAQGTPDTLRQILVREKKKTEHYVVADDVAGLISLAQIAALEIHAWGSRADKLAQPDRLIFDLDPDPQLPWSRVVQSARQVHQFLQDLGLESFLKTTGGKGLHLVVPIERRHDWEEAKAFCKRVAEAIVTADPRNYTANMTKAARPGKIFIDYHRNGRGATAIVPYSTRARPGAPVSTPLTWKELSAHTPSDHYTVRNLVRRLEALKRDPWQEIFSVRQGLAAPSEKLRALSRS